VIVDLKWKLFTGYTNRNTSLKPMPYYHAVSNEHNLILHYNKPGIAKELTILLNSQSTSILLLTPSSHLPAATRNISASISQSHPPCLKLGGFG